MIIRDLVVINAKIIIFVKFTLESSQFFYVIDVSK
jgi:hypothetical protein